MADDAESDEGGLPNLPATMADIFLALVGVVVIVLLSLAPAIRAPGALAAPPSINDTLSNVLIDGAPPLVLMAEKTGLRLREHPDRMVPLDDIRADPGLAATLRKAVADRTWVLLAIAPDGQEAAFLLEGLAGDLGLPSFYQLRLDAACGYVIDPATFACKPGASVS